MNNTVFLRVNGREWGGWTSVRISAGVDRVARDFNVTITRQWPGGGEGTPQIKNGDSVEVLIGTDLVITGWVEATPVRYDASQVTMGIVGRSKTADLIDCSAVATQYSGKSLVGIATSLAKPFGITVVDNGAPGTAVIDAQAEHGETAVETLNRLLGQVQALAYDDPQGRLVLGSVGSGKASTALVLGENILSCDTERSVRERFSDYLVTGQRPGTDDDFGEATISAIRQTTRDAGVSRYRPHTLQQSGTATTASCKARCEFEARQRAARTLETTYTVQGWRQGNGVLWAPNMRVIVWDPLLGFDNDELVIAEVTYSQDGNGTTTELRVGPADAYLPEPTKSKAKKKTANEDIF
jgi:prophage tail gpP-like protein